MAIHFYNDGNVYGVIRPKSHMEKILEQFVGWTDEDFKVVRLSLLSARKKEKFKNTCDGLLRHLNQIIAARKK